MTYFLPQTDQAIPPEALPPDLAPTGFLEGVGAAFNSDMLERNANIRLQREIEQEQIDVSDKAVGIIGEDAAIAMLKEKGVLLPGLADEVSYAYLRHDPKSRQAIIDHARELAASNPDLWQGIDLSDDGVDKRVNARLQAEYQDAQMTLSAMPGGGGAASFIGMTGSYLADIKNLPFLLFGGGSGSLLKVAGREALANMAGEAVNLPAEYDMAKRLDIPDPNPVQQLSEAALVGAGFGVAGELMQRALSRALTYFSEREKVITPPGVDPMAHAVAVEVAEDAIHAGKDPVEEVARVATPLWEAPAPEREPLIPPAAREAAPPAAANPIAPPVEPASTLPSPENATLAETLQGEADAMRKGAIGSKRMPFLHALKRNGVRIDPDSPEGQELRSMGITARTMPGLFSRKAKGERTALDTLVASEWDERLPGIWDATRTPRGTDGAYLDLNGVMDVIRRELSGDLDWIRPVADANQMERDAEDILRGVYDGPSEVDDFLTKKPADDGLFFAPYEVFEEKSPPPGEINAVRAKVGEYLFRRGIRDMLPSDLDDIAVELATYGGDAKFLIERALAREIDEIAPRIIGGSDGTARTAGGTAGASGRAAGASERNAAGQGAAGGDPAQPFGTERTSAGIQYVAPGIAPVTERARLEAAQSRTISGGDRPMDVGLFDTGARAQMDMFSDPTAPAAKAGQDAMARSLRDSIETDGDFTVDLMDGRGERAVSSLLDELDEDAAFNEILDACRSGRTE